jgi:hypothetical protein
MPQSIDVELQNFLERLSTLSSTASLKFVLSVQREGLQRAWWRWRTLPHSSARSR